MIISKITGGIGNQMFQYAIGRSISIRKKNILKLDKSFYLSQIKRDYELDLFNTIGEIASKEEISALSGIENFPMKVMRRLGLSVFKPKSYFREKTAAQFDDKVFDFQRDLYLDGYWQNENYFKNIRREILSEFTLKNDICHKAKEQLNKIKKTNSVALHVRRGDYITNTHAAKSHGICNINYYKKAVLFMTSSMSAPPLFYVFSDDIEWCKKNFTFLNNKVFIDDTRDALEDLELMKQCKNIIVANSTFSWWAAWLNQNKNKIVVCPEIWWTSRVGSNPAPNSWNKINNSMCE
jgi:hypothetical protein